MFGRRIEDERQIATMCYAMGYLDLHGQPTERPRFNYPYSYSEYVIKKLDWKEDDHAIYSDRLSMWYENLREVQAKHLNKRTDHYSNENPKAVEALLSELMEKEIELTAITETCNVSSGNPINIFYFRYL